MVDFGALAKDLSTKINSKITINEPLFKYCSWRVGGPAKVYIVADTLHDLKVILNTANKANLGYFIIGKGSNILVSDSGYNGLAIKLGKEFSSLRVEEDHIYAGSSVALSKIVNEAYRQGLSGLSFAIGIPGSVGGAVRMNAGAHGSNISSVITSITCLTKDLKLICYEKNDLTSLYRRSLVGKEEIVLEVVFKLKKANQASIKGHMERNFKQRKLTQPIKHPSAGSVFKNPKGFLAGKLIEEAGWKGAMLGGAKVSSKHANFIVNYGNATAQDIFYLLRLIQADVYQRFGVRLKPEVKVYGGFKEPKPALYETVKKEASSVSNKES
ncbi:MAG: UDP-N-acetylmuramate dehydrogenase [Actinobacteria bacterium]|nr:MAG: UDP-N-acetylmuramate dehydrogenase [Actinomycetota bacterium]